MSISHAVSSPHCISPRHHVSPHVKSILFRCQTVLQRCLTAVQQRILSPLLTHCQNISNLTHCYKVVTQEHQVSILLLIILVYPAI